MKTAVLGLMIVTCVGCEAIPCSNGSYLPSQPSQRVGTPFATNWAGSLLDLDRDGRLDAASISSGQLLDEQNLTLTPFDAKIHMRFGTGQFGAGAFGNESVQDLTFQDDVRGASVGDFDGDGWQDVVFPRNGASTVEVLLNRFPQVRFARTTPRQVGAGPFAIAISDFDRDGRLDGAVATSGLNEVSLLLGNGDGTFAPARQIPLSNVFTKTIPHAIGAGDLDADGRLDIVVAARECNPVPGQPLCVAPFRWQIDTLFGNGDGTFEAPRRLQRTSPVPRSMALGDLNQDGNNDLVFGGEGGVEVLLSLARALVVPIPGFFAASGGVSLRVADVSSDGKVDVLFLDPADARIRVLLGNGDGTLGAATSYSTQDPIVPTEMYPGQLLLGDMNCNGVADLAVFSSHQPRMDPVGSKFLQAFPDHSCAMGMCAP